MAVSTALLATKLYAPPVRAALVARPRLVARLADGLTRPLTLISAPAGFGKTTLLAEWLSQKDEGGSLKAEEKSQASTHPSAFIPQPSKVAWLSLDRGDNDADRFLTHLVAAIGT